MLNLLKVFEPNGVLFITWEIFHMFTILVIFFWIPFKLSFNIQAGSNLIEDNVLEFLKPSVYYFDS
jgi:hypothetical protein